MTESVARDLFGGIDEDEMYRRALAIPLEKKIFNAVAMIQMYEPIACCNCRQRVFMWHLAVAKTQSSWRNCLKWQVKYQLWYNNVTSDPPVVYQYRMPPSEMEQPGRNLYLFREKWKQKQGPPPTHIARWCCRFTREQGEEMVY